MGLKDCQIIFDNPYNTYYAGQTVNGRIELNFDSPKKVRGIVVCLKGEGDTSWYEEQSRTNNEGKTENERIDLTGQEEYFKIQYYLLGGASGGETELPAGQHVYPFTCVLPPTLPSSFEGEFGHVRYTVKVVLDRPWKFDQEIKAAFTVLSPVDLNKTPSTKDPVKRTLEKFFCCFCCKSGPLTVVVSLPQSGYVPGQVVPILAEIDNISNVAISNVHFSFQKIIAYHSQSPRRETKREVVVLQKMQIGAVEAGGSKTFNQPLTLPALPPSNLTNCSLIDLDYEIQVECVVSGMHTNLTTKIPLTIGTIPLMNGAAGAPSAPVESPADAPVAPASAEGGQQPGWSTAGLYPNLQPSFQPSQFGTDTIQDRNDNQHTRYNSTNFSPMYPVYNFQNNP